MSPRALSVSGLRDVDALPVLRGLREAPWHESLGRGARFHFNAARMIFSNAGFAGPVFSMSIRLACA